MIDIFVCVKPRYPRGGDDHRSEIDRGCVSGFGNKEVIVESIRFVRFHHRSNPLYTNFKRNNFHTRTPSLSFPTRVKNSKEIGLFDPYPV